MKSVEQRAEAADLQKNRILAATCYIWLLFLFSFVLAKDSRLAIYHARQGALLFGFSLVATAVMKFTPPWMAGAADLITLAWIVLIVVGITNAWKGRLRPLPLIGRLWN